MSAAIAEQSEQPSEEPIKVGSVEATKRLQEFVDSEIHDFIEMRKSKGIQNAPNFGALLVHIYERMEYRKAEKDLDIRDSHIKSHTAILKECPGVNASIYAEAALRADILAAIKSSLAKCSTNKGKADEPGIEVTSVTLEAANEYLSLAGRLKRAALQGYVAKYISKHSPIQESQTLDQQAKDRIISAIANAINEDTEGSRLINALHKELIDRGSALDRATRDVKKVLAGAIEDKLFPQKSVAPNP